MKTTRQRILDYLAAHHSATAAGLGAALQVTSADIRHHLANLRSEGLVIRSAAPAQAGDRRVRGRPARRYSLPDQGPDPGLTHLLLALLAETCAVLPPPEQEILLRRLAARLAALPGGSPSSAAGLTQRLVFAVQRLNQLGYRARWEARAAGPRLILEHRPFASLEAHHPLLATLETFLLEDLLGGQASRIEIQDADSFQ